MKFTGSVKVDLGEKTVGRKTLFFVVNCEMLVPP